MRARPEPSNRVAVKEIAALALADERSVRKYLDGDPLKPLTEERIRLAVGAWRRGESQGVTWRKGDDRPRTKEPRSTRAA